MLKIFVAKMKVMQGRNELFDEVMLVKTTTAEERLRIPGDAFKAWCGLLFTLERDINADGHLRCHIEDVEEYDMGSLGPCEHVVWENDKPVVRGFTPASVKDAIDEDDLVARKAVR